MNNIWHITKAKCKRAERLNMKVIAINKQHSGLISWLTKIPASIA